MPFYHTYKILIYNFVVPTRASSYNFLTKYIKGIKKLLNAGTATVTRLSCYPYIFRLISPIALLKTPTIHMWL